MITQIVLWYGMAAHNPQKCGVESGISTRRDGVYRLQLTMITNLPWVGTSPSVVPHLG